MMSWNSLGKSLARIEQACPRCSMWYLSRTDFGMSLRASFRLLLTFLRLYSRLSEESRVFCKAPPQRSLGLTRVRDRARSPRERLARWVNSRPRRHPLQNLAQLLDFFPVTRPVALPQQLLSALVVLIRFLDQRPEVCRASRSLTGS